MADGVEETNTAVEESDSTQPEADVLEVPADNGVNSDAEDQKAKPVAESNWSAPILSLARKASETISSGVNYGAALRNVTAGSTVSSPVKENSENETSTNTKFPGK